MNDPLRTLLEPTSLARNLFPPTSRYHGVSIAETTTPDGRPLKYLRRRFVPPPERFETIQEHQVAAGDRLDNLAARYLGDPEQFWRLADANGALRPEQLTETVGRVLRITLPEGISGATHV